MTKKTANDNKTFKKGDYIVYPAHGVGRVTGVEKETVAGFDIEVYVVSFEQDKMTLRVPTGKAVASGMDLTGKTAIVTGGASGIGLAVAKALHAKGARIAIADLNAVAASEAGKTLGGFGESVNVGDEAALVRFINKVERTLGPVDIYISNAGLGVTDGPGWGAGDAPNASWNLCWQVNVMA